MATLTENNLKYSNIARVSTYERGLCVSKAGLTFPKLVNKTFTLTVYKLGCWVDMPTQKETQ